MPKKIYKHIKLPKQLISGESEYIPPPRRIFSEKKEFNRENHKRKLASNIRRIRRFYEDRAGERQLQDNKGNVEVRIGFRGLYNPKFIRKYGIDIYKITQGKNENEFVYGKIGNLKQQGQKLSDFERLQKEVLKYQETNRNKTYFDFIRDIRPLELKEIIEPDLFKEMKECAESDFQVDISFAGTKESAQIKITSIEKKYPRNFIAKVNTQTLHYCRIKANLREIENICKDFVEISSIERSPIYVVETAVLQRKIENASVLNPPSGLTPAFVFDTDVNQNHLTLKGAVDNLLHNDGSDPEHGTAVASLVVCGSKLAANGTIQQDNRVIAVKVSADKFSKLDQIIQETVEAYAPKFPLLIANLSVNVTSVIYPRHKEVNKLTIMLDDLAKQYGCLFVISAGNLFFKTWGAALVQKCQNMGYPEYFKEKCTHIAPPADSINNISVGSVAFQASVDSLVGIKSPTVHTRGNLDNFPFVKPDLVHYDSNYRSDFSCEENGVLMAGINNDSLTSMPGTSFSTPLVTHDLILLHNKYPELNANSLKALIIHSADKNIGEGIRSKKIREKLIGFGLPNAEDATYSDNHRSTIIIEDSIEIGKEKKVRFPVPASIAGSSRKRLRITKTLVYNPLVNAKNPRLYNPIHIFSQLLRSDDQELDSRTTRTLYSGAHMKSNVKKYPAVEKSTRNHVGSFWYLRIVCENKDDAFIPSGYKQTYSIVLTIEDMDEQDGINIHEDIHNMIEIETQIRIPVEVIM